MTTKPSFLASLCVASMLSLGSLAFGEVIFQKDFTLPGETTQSDLSGMRFWSGAPVNTWGEILIEPLPSGVVDSPKKALSVFTNSTNPQAPDGSRFAPSIVIKTPGFGAGGQTKTAVYSLRFLIPIDQKYRADIHFGGSWDSNATILMLGSNNLKALIRGTPTSVGEYVANVWQELRVEFDCENKSYSIFLNGKTLAEGLPWNNPKLSSIESLGIFPGEMPVDQDRTAVFYIEKIEISGKQVSETTKP